MAPQITIYSTKKMLVPNCGDNVFSQQAARGDFSARFAINRRQLVSA